MTTSPSIAYFSMEIALEAGMPTYAGGLGVLAGDTIRAAADAGLPLVAVTLLHRKGYFHQRFDARGMQVEEPVRWSVDDFVSELPTRIQLTLRGRVVSVRAWRREVTGIGGKVIPVYFLDSDVPENEAVDRSITDHLYGGDRRYRLLQEAVLGLAGVRMLRAIGYDQIERYHMNEGHSSLLVLELLEEHLSHREGSQASQEDLAAVREKCVFTTHTPVPAGHDQFPRGLAEEVLGSQRCVVLGELFGCRETLNMTHLALEGSHFVNGVARKHGEVSRQLFPMYRIDWITNGVHAGTWVSPPFRQLFDEHVRGWREDNFALRASINIPKDEVWQAHREAKWRMLEYVNHVANSGMDVDFLTLGFGRRMTEYKRPGLLFSDVQRLRALAQKHGPIQIVCSGKAHPHDGRGKELIQSILAVREVLGSDVRLAFVENYDMTVAKLMVAGVDVWLNTPEPPLEASGTSGMKAALNGVPSLSVLDGWWLEGCIENLTGWSLQGGPATGAGAAEELYGRLDDAILPCFYKDHERFVDIMRHSIALNGSYFHAQRMLQQYVVKAYVS